MYINYKGTLIPAPVKQLVSKLRLWRVELFFNTETNICKLNVHIKLLHIDVHKSHTHNYHDARAKNGKVVLIKRLIWLKI